MDTLTDAFEPIRGLPSWEVRQGHGSFLTLEFGTPRVEIGDVRELPSHVGADWLRVPRRTAHVAGEWHLWISCCAWSLSWNGREIARSESTDLEIRRALRVLNGQSITAVSAGTPDGRSTFTFDLSCVLETRPDGDSDDEEQWLFFQPCGDVLKLRADGRLQTSRSDEP